MIVQNQKVSHYTNRKIMLIEPPFYRLYHDQYCLVKYPLALGYLSGAIIKNTNWNVQTYNADFNARKKNFVPENDYITGKGFERYLSSIKDFSYPIWKEVKNSIEEYNPSVIGISAKTQNFISTTIVAKIAKEINPEIKIIVGGVHPTMNGSKILNHKSIDFLSIGEGENTIVELLLALEKNTELNSVNGIIFRDNGKIVNTKPRSYVEDLNSLDFPLINAPKVLKDFDKYPKEAFGYVFASRGCPYACTFCESKSMWTRKVRYRSPENIVAELKQMQEFGINKVYTVDINPNSTNTCKKVVSNNVEIATDDSVRYLNTLCNNFLKNKTKVSMFYLDSYDVDWRYTYPSAAHHLKELVAINRLLEKDTLVVVDDSPAVGHLTKNDNETNQPWKILKSHAPTIGGKGFLVHEYAVHVRAKLVFAHYQVAWNEFNK